MNILVFEPSIKGHHLNYLYIILDTFRESDIRVTVLTLDINKELPLPPELSDSKFINIHYIELNKFISRIYFGPKLYNKEVINFLLVRKYLSSQKRNTKFNLIFFPYVDGLARLLSLLPNPFYGVKWSGISMVPTFHLKKMGLTKISRKFSYLEEKWFLKLLQKDQLTKLFTIDPPLYDYITSNYPKIAGKIKYIADPVNVCRQVDKKSARQYFGLDQNLMIVLLYGYISERKGVIELIELLQHEEVPENLKVVIAGVQDEDIKAKILKLPIQKSSHKILFIDRFISEEEKSMLLQGTDIVWCAYKHFYSMSSVLVHAAAMGKPVLASKEGVISWFTSKYEIGELVDIFDKESIIKGLKKLTNNKELYNKYVFHAEHLGKMHTVAKFKETIIKEMWI